MRWLALVLALAVSTPAQADALEPGVYEGKIGPLPIRACLDDGSFAAGTYYYLKHLRPIALRKGEATGQDTLAEFIGYEDRTGGEWLSLRQTGEKITGQWSNGRRLLPIRLKSVTIKVDDYSSPCEAKQFLGPRLAAASIVPSAEQFSGVPITRLTFDHGPYFDAEAVSIASFVLGGPPQPGDAAINMMLRRVLPMGVDDSDSDFLSCMGDMHAQTGQDGSFEHHAQPEVLTTRWLGVLHARSVYCGGAHPSFWQNRQVFDRQTGAEVDPAGWFTKGALGFYQYEDQDGLYPKRPVAGLSEDLYKVMRRYWPIGEDNECIDVIDGKGYGWDIGLGQTGLILKPELPHVATACIESVAVPWADLEPFLSEAGRAVRDSLR